MKKFDLRTPVIYVLSFIIIVLLIILKQQDDLNKELALKEKIEKVETKKKERPHKIFPEVPPPELKGKIGIIIDDFGYRNDEISDGLSLIHI